MPDIIISSNADNTATFGPGRDNGLGWRRRFSTPSMTITPASAWATGSANTVTVSLSDGDSGVSVALTSNSANGVVSSSPVVTNGSGDAVFTVTPDSDGGAFTITASTSGYPDATLAVTVGAGSAIFSDGFETGDFTNTGGGFSWGSRANTAVSTDNPFAGSYSLKFIFGPDAPGNDSWSEQRFAYPLSSEVWMEYMLYIPSNYEHRNEPASNNKFFQFYNNNNNMLTVELSRQDNTSSGFRRFLSESENSDGSTNWPVSTSGVNDIIGPTGSYPMNPGNWHKVGIHYRAATDANTSDGLAEVWIDDVVVHELSWPFWDNVYGGHVNGGYLLGFSNSGYTNRTEFFVDNVNLYTSDPGWGV